MLQPLRTRTATATTIDRAIDRRADSDEPQRDQRQPQDGEVHVLDHAQLVALRAQQRLKHNQEADAQ